MDNYNAADQPVEQPGNSEGLLVTRQRGLAPEPAASVDPTPERDIIQGSPEIHTTRQVGNGHQRFLQDGSLAADHRSEDGIFYSDVPLVAASDQPMPPPSAFEVVRSNFDYAPSAAGAPPAQPPVVRAMQADQPDDRGGDPRDGGSRPVTITPEQIAAAKAAAKKGRK